MDSAALIIDGPDGPSVEAAVGPLGTALHRADHGRALLSVVAGERHPLLLHRGATPWDGVSSGATRCGDGGARVVVVLPLWAQRAPAGQRGPGPLPSAATRGRGGPGPRDAGRPCGLGPGLEPAHASSPIRPDGGAGRPPTRPERPPGSAGRGSGRRTGRPSPGRRPAPARTLEAVRSGYDRPAAGTHDADARWRGAMTEAEEFCHHLDQVQEVEPCSDGCEDCLRHGGRWVHLRLCMICGHVGCCDNSPGSPCHRPFRRDRASPGRSPTSRARSGGGATSTSSPSRSRACPASSTPELGHRSTRPGPSVPTGHLGDRWPCRYGQHHLWHTSNE